MRRVSNNVCDDGTKPFPIMSDSDRQIPDNEALRDEALRWLRRLSSGEAVTADSEALDQWRARSPRHARQFAEAALLWNMLGEATSNAVDRNPALGATVILPDRNARLARRAFLVGGGALAAAAAGALVIRPPFDLWPSLSEFAADYRTQTGEHQQIEVAGHITVQMNTRTSIDLRPAGDGIEQIELLAGEAAIAKRDPTSRELVVLAGDGRAAATKATFNVRKDGGAVSVTSIDGDVDVRCSTGTVTIRNGQQITYDERGLGEIATIDADAITAWQRGLLVFRDTPLARVIDEVNRYRAGRIILLDTKVGLRRVVANFRLDRIDDVIVFVSQVMNVPARSLPGGIVLLG
jgi:transmembrane sensor